MDGNLPEIAIGRQHREVVTEAELREQRVDRTDLDAAAPATVSQLGGRNMVPPIGDEQRQRR